MQGAVGTRTFSIGYDGVAKRELFEVLKRTSNGWCLRYRSMEGEHCTLGIAAATKESIEVTTPTWQALPIHESLVSLSPWQAALDYFAKDLVTALDQCEEGRTALSQHASTFGDYCRLHELVVSPGLPIQ